MWVGIAEKILKVSLSFAGSLAALIYQHSITPISLPCKLVLPVIGECIYFLSAFSLIWFLRGTLHRTSNKNWVLGSAVGGLSCDKLAVCTAWRWVARTVIIVRGLSRPTRSLIVVIFSVASLTLVSPGLITDGVTLYFFFEKVMTFLVIVFKIDYLFLLIVTTATPLHNPTDRLSI